MTCKKKKDYSSYKNIEMDKFTNIKNIPSILINYF